MIPEWLRALMGDTAAPGLEAATPWLIGAAIFGYLLGSIPFGVLISRAAGLGDLRAVGSGNIGATNVLRTGSKKAAAATLLLDGFKASAAVMIARDAAGLDAGAIAGAMAVVGHCFPVWLKFKGGKGVATFLGFVLAVSWPSGLIALAMWLAMAALFRYSSFAALVMAFWTPVVLNEFGVYEAVLLSAALAVLIFARHRANIGRLLRGTEPMIGGGRAKS